MKRRIVLSIEEKLGFDGDYNSFAAWGQEKVLVAKISEYVMVKRPDNIFEGNINSDLAILAVRSYSTEIWGINQVFKGTHLLILHRYPDGDWDYSDPNVFIFGIENSALPLKIDSWYQNAILMSTAAIMGVMSQHKKSEMGQFFERYEEI